MSAGKQTVQNYMDAFARSDHAGVLACLTDDVEWDIPGMFCDVFIMRDAKIRRLTSYAMEINAKE